MGSLIVIGDTTHNAGTAAAAATFTKHYLSTNGTTPQYFVGTRGVSPLAPGGDDTGSTTGSILAGTPEGTYYMLACADRGPGAAGGTSEVEETNENNNCLASATQITVSAPDLRTSNVTVSTPNVDRNFGTLTVSDTVTNNGGADAGQSQTRWYLSADQTLDVAAGDLYVRNCTNGGPIPGRTIPILGPGASSSGPASTNPLCVRDNSGALHPVATGFYYVISCADEERVVSESNETNNCGVTGSTFRVVECGNTVIEPGEQCDDGNRTGGDGCNATCQSEVSNQADLTTTTITNPPTSRNAGQNFPITDTVRNIGGSNAPSTTQTYFLSLDTVRDLSDRQLNGGRTVPALPATTGINTATATVVIPAGTTPGTYFVISCADGPNAVAEGNETNNCITSAGQIAVGGSDLQVTAVSNPPATASPGSTFIATDTTRNNGPGSASATFTKYYLSSNGTTRNFVLGSRSVSALGNGASSASGNTTVTVNAAGGTYFLLACADQGSGTTSVSQVTETNENNNCLASATTVTIQAPDLIVSDVPAPPPGPFSIGQTFTVSDTTNNIGTTATPAFFNKYYLSPNGVFAQFYFATRSIPGGIAAGGSDTGSVTGTVRTNVTPGNYQILVCSDAGPGTAGKTSQIVESNEKNNCRASGATVQIQ